MTVPEPGQPGYPTDRLGQLRNYLQRLDDDGELIELDDVTGYLDDSEGLRLLTDSHDAGLMRSTMRWLARRERLYEQEANGPIPSADEWAWSDDDAAELLRGIAAALGWTPGPGPVFGCAECNFTGLHMDPAEVGAPIISNIERHDACEAFDNDFQAAAFVALCHPQYRYIVYRTDHAMAHSFEAATYDLERDYPTIEFAGRVMLTTFEGLPAALAQARRGD